MSDPVISTHGLSKTYSHWFRPDVHAVRSLTLEIPAGEVYGFLGPNGAGKTTTLRMLLGAVLPTRGSGKILGNRLGDREAKRNIGFLPDNPKFPTHFTGAQFLAYSAKLFGMQPHEYEPRINALLNTCGLVEAKDRRLANYSRGMIQRIGLAQARINDPALLILDEPLTGLDPSGRKQMRDMILGLKQDGKTVFFSSHILYEVEDLCDQAAIMNHGKLLTHGALCDLLGTDRTELTAKGVTEACLQTILSDLQGFRKRGDTCVLWIQDSPESNTVQQVITHLTDAGASEIAVVRERKNLEEFFLEVIEADECTS